MTTILLADDADALRPLRLEMERREDAHDAACAAYRAAKAAVTRSRSAKNRAAFAEAETTAVATSDASRDANEAYATAYNAAMRRAQKAFAAARHRAAHGIQLSLPL